MTEQKYKLYSTALCISGREALATINGREVSVVGFRNAGALGSLYTVTHESKSPRSFECFERDLRPVVTPTNSECDDPYAVIRNMLGCYLHQDFDLHYDSVADALNAAIRQADKSQLALALDKLEREPDEVISDVLGDHDVDMPRRYAAMLNRNACWAMHRSFVVNGFDDYCDQQACLPGSVMPHDTGDAAKLSCRFDCIPAILQAVLPGSKTSGTKNCTTARDCALLDG